MHSRWEPEHKCETQFIFKGDPETREFENRPPVFKKPTLRFVVSETESRPSNNPAAILARYSNFPGASSLCQLLTTPPPPTAHFNAGGHRCSPGAQTQNERPPVPTRGASSPRGDPPAGMVLRSRGLPRPSQPPLSADARSRGTPGPSVRLTWRASSTFPPGRPQTKFLGCCPSCRTAAPPPRAHTPGPLPW